MSVKSAPEAPDFQGVAAQQTAANRPNQSSPFASSQWEQKKAPAPPPGSSMQDIIKWANDPGQWTQTQQFAGGIQDAATGLADQAGQLGQAMDWSQFGQMKDGSAARDQAIEAAYGQATSRLDPQWQKREEAQRTQLLNQGLDPSSEAYRNAASELGQQRNDAYSSAMNSAILQGDRAGEAVFRQNMMARQQAISEALKQRGMPVEEMRALMGMLQQPNFAQDQSLSAALGGYNAQLGGWQAQNQANADFWGGALDAAGGIGQMAMMLSDERLKQDIERHDVEAMPGVPFASWTWRHNGVRDFGVIAQDVAQVAPHLVTEHPSGFLMVNYTGILEG